MSSVLRSSELRFAVQLLWNLLPLQLKTRNSVFLEVHGWLFTIINHSHFYEKNHTEHFILKVSPLKLSDVMDWNLLHPLSVHVTIFYLKLSEINSLVMNLWYFISKTEQKKNIVYFSTKVLNWKRLQHILFIATKGVHSLNSWAILCFIYSQQHLKINLVL